MFQNNSTIMKVIKFLFSFVLGSVIIASCAKINEEDNEKDPTIPINPISPDSTYVSMGIGGEFVASPLSKAGSSNDLFAVNVRRVDSNGQFSTVSNYAYGVFDDIGKAVFKLAKRYYYAFEVACIPNGKNVLYKYREGVYGVPCYSVEDGYAEVNKIVYSSNSALCIGTNDAQDRNHSQYQARYNEWSPIERYQGVCARFDPNTSDNVVVDLYRQMVGFTITIEDFTSGTVTIHGMCEDAHRYSVSAVPGQNKQVLKAVFESPTMPYIGKGEFPINIIEASEEEIKQYEYDITNFGENQVYIRYSDGESKDIILYYRFDFKFQRNTNYSLTFSLSDAIANGGISVNLVDEGDEMNNLPFEL